MSAFLPKMSAAEFNAKFPVGTEFDYYSVRGGREVCEPFQTKTRSEAWTLGHGAVVVACDGKAGGLDITHLKQAFVTVEKSKPELWQSIETAPKDGTVILTYGMGHGNKIFSHDCNEKPFPMFAMAYWTWHDDFKDIAIGGGLFRKEPCRILEGWRTEWSYRPTHWMPLPEAPIDCPSPEPQP